MYSPSMNTSVPSGPKPMPPMSIRCEVHENSADQLAPVEARRGDDEVVEVPGAHPGIVGDVGVARLHGVEPEMGDEVLDRLRHGVDVARRAGDGLRQHASLAVEDAGRQVARLAHDRENAVRSSVCACSSTTAISRFHMICRAMSPIGLDMGRGSFEHQTRTRPAALPLQTCDGPVRGIVEAQSAKRTRQNSPPVVSKTRLRHDDGEGLGVG